MPIKCFLLSYSVKVFLMMLQLSYSMSKLKNIYIFLYIYILEQPQKYIIRQIFHSDKVSIHLFICLEDLLQQDSSSDYYAHWYLFFNRIYNIHLQILKSEKRSAREHIDNVETIIVVTIPWASYLVAFHLKLSGIVSVMFCGIAMGNYVMPNLSP